MAGFEIHDFDFNKLIQFASKAKGDVFLETPDGDVTGATWAPPASSAKIRRMKPICSA